MIKLLAFSDSEVCGEYLAMMAESSLTGVLSANSCVDVEVVASLLVLASPVRRLGSV